jgi:hypothetical protein
MAWAKDDKATPNKNKNRMILDALNIGYLNLPNGFYPQRIVSCVNYEVFNKQK